MTINIYFSIIALYPHSTMLLIPSLIAIVISAECLSTIPNRSLSELIIPLMIPIQRIEDDPSRPNSKNEDPEVESDRDEVIRITLRLHPARISIDSSYISQE